MRIAVVYPQRDRWTKMAWVRESLLDLGHDVRHVRGGGSQVHKDLEAADAWAELVLFEQKCAGVGIGDLVRIGAKAHAVWVSWNFDLMALEEGKPLSDQLTVHSKNHGCKEATPWLRQLRAMDVAFVKERGLLDEYRALGVRAEYLDQGCPDWLGACEHQETPHWDVLVLGKWGRSWRKRRHAAVLLADEGFHVAWAGHAGGDSLPTGIVPVEWTPPDRLPELVSNAACVLCVDYRTDLDGYTSDRTWLVAGMGAVMLRPDGWLPPGPYLSYDSDDRLVELVQAAKRDWQARKEIGAEARRWVLGGHTVKNRCETLLEKISSCGCSTKAPADTATAAAR